MITSILIGVIGLYFVLVLAYNRSHMKTLYIIRGLPGSGKTTLAKQIALEKNAYHFEADMYFTDPDGNYHWDKNKIMDAHDWCQDQVRYRIFHDQSVIVSNTFTRWREMREYVDLALENGFAVEVIQCLGDFGSVHGVPAETLDKMKDRFIGNSDLPNFLGVTYRDHIPVAECASTIYSD